MRSATRTVVATFGTLVGLAGIEHGAGEVLQGNVVPEGPMILSWPDSPLFANLSGEPAMTIVPNLLMSGILAILSSLLFIAWATRFAERRRAALVLLLLCPVMLLVGAGFGPPVLGLIVAATVTGVSRPPTWWRRHVPAGAQRLLAGLWRWFYAALLVNWLLVLPGLAVLGYLFGVDDWRLTLGLLAGMFSLLFLTIVSGFAHDAQQRPGPAAAAPTGAAQHGRRLACTRELRVGDATPREEHSMRAGEPLR